MHWLEEPLKIIDRISVDRSLLQNREFNIEKVIDEKIRLGFNAEHFSAHIRGEKPLKYIDFVKSYAEVAKKKGLKVFLYVNVHWHDVSDARKHPSWFQVNYKGSLIRDVYGSGVMPCVNSNGYREFIFDALRKLAKTGINGIFLDGPVFHPKGCYCRSCRTKFRKKYGIEIPKKGDFENKAHRLLIEFQQLSLKEFLKGAYDAIKKANRYVAMYMNGEPVRPNWVSGRDNVLLKQHQDLIGAEGGFEYYNLIESPFFKCEMTAKLLQAQAPEKPRVIFIAAKHSPWNREVLTPEELKVRCAEAIANGANYWIGITFPNKKLYDAIKEINSWIDGNEEYYTKTADASDVGLYWSQDTANFYGGEVPTSDFTGRKIKVKRDYMKSFIGAYELLLRLHIPFKVVVDPRQFDGLKVLILPNTAVLGDKEIRGIRNFVEGGGLLISSYETALYDYNMNRHHSFHIEDVFGTTFMGIEDYDGYENYFEILGEDIPAPTYVIKSAPTTGVPLGTMYENTRGWYQEIEKSKYPSVVLNDYGLGKSIYIAGNFFQTYYEYKIASYLRIFDKILSRFYEYKVKVLNAPTSLSVSLRRKNSYYILHLVNFTSDLKRPIEYVSPLKNVKVVLKINNENISEVEAIIGKRPLKKLKFYRDKIMVNIPKIEVYEALVFKTG